MPLISNPAVLVSFSIAVSGVLIAALVQRKRFATAVVLAGCVVGVVFYFMLTAVNNATLAAAAESAKQSARADALRRESEHLNVTADRLFEMQAEDRTERLLSQPRYREPKRLNRYESRIYAQAGEDGMIAEIFRRIGTTNRTFVEYGSGSGQENNTVWLLRNGWRGLWIDADDNNVTGALVRFAPEARAKRLSVQRAYVTAENIEDIFAKAAVPAEFDLLSSDIDGNDYWVWKKIEHYRPRVVVIEYNAMFPPGVEWVQEYNAKGWWDGTSHFGASLTALEKLGAQKGYKLVGCNLGGVDSFFVREDLVRDQFQPPYTAENHYEPIRYFLQLRAVGYTRRP